MPNASTKLTKNCEFIGNICHNTTELRKPLVIHSVLYQGSMKLYNFTNSGDCKSLKKKQTNEFMKVILTFNGLRICDNYKLGVHCLNSTIFTETNPKNAFQMLSITAKTGDIFRLVDNIVFENGGKSCITSIIEVRKSR